MPSCFVLFPTDSWSLEDAASALRASGLSVIGTSTALTVAYGTSPRFTVRRLSASHVAVIATRIRAGSPHATALSACHSGFEITFDSLAEALDEINTLMEIQGGLQDLTQGLLFTPWNGGLSEAWQE